MLGRKGVITGRRVEEGGVDLEISGVFWREPIVWFDLLGPRHVRDTLGLGLKLGL